jgi:hypothetical protein
MYALIESQVNNIMKVMLVDDQTGEVYYGGLVPGPKWVGLIVQLIASIVFLSVALFFGLYLWNYGLAPVFPNIVAPISPSNPSQSGNAYVQLTLTLFALMMFL